MAKNVSVMGIYPDRTMVADAVSVLSKGGYRATDISVLASDNLGSKDFGHSRRRRAGDGAAMGAVVGAVVGAALAWYISTQPIAPEGISWLAGVGPVLAAVAGVGAGGALGWLIGLLVGLFLTEYVARRYAGRTRGAGILLSVHCDSPEWCVRARKLLKDSGARDISSAAEAGADFGTTDKPTERAPAMVVVPVATPILQPVELVAPQVEK